MVLMAAVQHDIEHIVMLNEVKHLGVSQRIALRKWSCGQHDKAAAE
jgi:hypothetical protein